MKFGSSNIANVKLGSSTVSKVYVGSTQVWPAESAYSAPDYVSSGLQVYYNPEDPSSYSGSGSTITDLSGNGFTGTISGATHSTNSFLYDGTNDFIYTPNMYSAFSANRNITVEVWYNPTWTNANEGGTVVSEVASIAYDNWHYAMIEHERAPFGALAYDYAGFWTGTSVTPVNPFGTTNGWRQIVLSYDGTTARSYLNAGTAREVVLTRNVPWIEGSVNSFIIVLGHGDGSQQSGSGQNYFKGNIGIVRVYNRALSSEEITSNYNNTKSIYGL